MSIPPPPPPPLPPLPPNMQAGQNNYNNPPPVPPLPKDYYNNNRYDYESPPHFSDPLVAPRPHKLDPDLPANITRTLDEQANGGGYRSLQDPYLTANSGAPRGPSPQPPMNYNPGFPTPTSNGPSFARQSVPSPLPNPQGSAWGPWNPNLSSPPPNQYGQQQPQYPQPSPQPQYPPQYPQQQQQQQQYSPQPPQQQYSPQPQPQQYSPRLQPQQYSPQPPQQQYPPRQSPPQRFESPQPQYQSPRPSDTLSPAMANLSFGAPQVQPRQRVQSMYTAPPQAASPPKQINAVPSLTSQLPTVATLNAVLPSIQQPTHDPALKIAWCRDVFFIVDRLQTSASAAEIPIGPARILDPQLLRLTQIAVPLVLQIASPSKMPQPMPVYVAEAIFLRATFAASGAYPDQVKQNPRTAFRDFEQAARSGYNAAWFRLGRDYENFNDFPHAKDCFERGVKLGVESCCYRMGMAHLMGQLGLPASYEAALPLLQRAATLASVEVPQPAYVYALLLLSEFSHVSIPEHLFKPYIPPSSSLALEARKHLERAAYLNFAPAQYKLGHAYEFAQPPFPFDPLLSVQYYSLASQQGETEADMALSKWFLCGSEGSFEKDEGLAFTFAEKAARKGLPSAEFALGYYAEVGVGGPKDIEVARKWYTRASDHGNSDAIDRLAALNQPSPQALSRQEHDTITEAKLIRKRTQAKQRSDVATGGNPSPLPQTGTNGRQVIEVVRKNSVNYDPGPTQGATAPGLGPIMERRGSASIAVQNSSPGSDFTGGPQLRAYPNSHRYTLTDMPSQGPASGIGGHAQSLGGGRPAGRPPASRLQSSGNLSTEPSPSRPSKTGPTTFAEMGITAAKAEDKECVIM